MTAFKSSAIFKKPLFKNIYAARYIYLLLIPGLAYYIVFRYFPIYGITLAFKQFKANLGIIGSPFIGLQNYRFVFRDPYFFRALKNTFIISLERIIFQFPVPIILALLLNEIKSGKFKKVLQTIFTFPNFISWVIVAGIVVNLLASDGAVNGILRVFGFEPINFLTDSKIFLPMLYVSYNWKVAGWSCIIYLSAIMGISMDQYDSALIDGANRLQKIIYITLPGIKSTISVMFILAIGNIMNAGFDQVFNMYNPGVYEIADILDTYIYRVTFSGPTDFGFSTAIGLFKSVINFTLLIICDRIVKALGENGLFY